MKHTLAFLAAVVLVTPALRAEPDLMPWFGGNTIVLNDQGLEDLLSRSRVSVGMDRDAVVNHLGNPQVVIKPNVWAFTSFRAENTPAPERYDTLLVVFEKDQVVRLSLTNAQAIRTAMAKVKSRSDVAAK